MDKRSDLSTQIKKLDKKEMEILRLKYGDGRSYKEIAQALKISTEEVSFKLFSALKQLGADGAASLSDAERAKLLSFIHGELEQADLQSMATRIEGEEGLRKEFEAWLAVSDELEKLLAKPSAAPPGMAAPKKTIPKQFWLAGAVVLAVGIALPLLKPSPEGDAAQAVLSPPDTPAPESHAVAPADNLKAMEEPPVQAAVEPAPAGEVAPAETSSQLANEMSPAGEAAHSEPASISPNEMGRGRKVFDGNPDKKMGVFASKVKVSKNLNTKKVLHTLQQRLDGKPSCVPPKLAHLKSVNVTIRLNADGGISKMEPDPRNKAIAKCLKRLLDDKPLAFKPSKKGSTQIALSLKNF
jgi:DNA-binding CsgD family transcriptional regulator